MRNKEIRIKNQDEEIERFTDEVSKVFPDAHLGIHRAIDM